jgi:hypothetical protein
MPPQALDPAPPFQHELCLYCAPVTCPQRCPHPVTDARSPLLGCGHTTGQIWALQCCMRARHRTTPTTLTGSSEILQRREPGHLHCSRWLAPPAPQPHLRPLQGAHRIAQAPHMRSYSAGEKSSGRGLEEIPEPSRLAASVSHPRGIQTHCTPIRCPFGLAVWVTCSGHQLYKGMEAAPAEHPHSYQARHGTRSRCSTPLRAGACPSCARKHRAGALHCAALQHPLKSVVLQGASHQYRSGTSAAAAGFPRSRALGPRPFQYHDTRSLPGWYSQSLQEPQPLYQYRSTGTLQCWRLST